jgi:uncharacterized membrane protein YqaE (UPF0057 family)
MVEMDCCIDDMVSCMELIPPLYRCQCLQNLSITDILWRWKSRLRRGCHIRYCYRNMRGWWHIIIRIVSPQLGIGLHQSLLADGILDLHLWLTSYTNARL